jgi:hypothetical protein
MLKYILSAVTLAVVVTHVPASAVEVSLGVKGGLNLATFYGEDTEGYYDDRVMKPGMVIGAALGLKLADMFAIQPEVLYSQKGYAMSGEIMGVEYKGAYKMDYIEIPVLLKFLIPAGPVTPNLFAGPALGLRAAVGGYDEVDGDREEFDDDTKTEMKESSNVVDFGLAMGAGIDIGVGPGSILIDVRYTLGFLKIAKLSQDMEDAGMTEDDLTADKNGALGFAVGYAFNF